MSFTSADQENVDEHLLQHHEVSETKNDTSTEGDTKVNYERLSRYNTLVKMGKISRDYIENGIRMHVTLDTIGDSEWDIILEEMHNKEYPLRELQLCWRNYTDEPVESGFIEFAKTIQTHTTLIKLNCRILRILWDAKATVLLEALKNNRSIKHLSLNSNRFDPDSANGLAQTLMNNQTLLSLDLSVNPCSEYNQNSFESIDVETVVKLARSLQTTALEWLEINEINNEGFNVLVQYLPKTLVHLDLSNNEINGDSIPTLHSYLKSNGSTLKELILDHTLATEYLQKEESSTLPTIKVISSNNWQATFLRNEEPFRLEPMYMSDSDWSDLFMKLPKDDPIYREIHLVLHKDFDRNQLNYIRTLLGKQYQLTKLTIIDYLLDVSIELELVQLLKQNNSIIELGFCFEMNSNIFNELVDLLANKNNIIRLNLSNNSNINDEQAVMLSQVLKDNTVLQSLSLIESSIGDIGFQALLSSLPNSLSQLIVDNSRISAKSLPSLLAFIKVHPTLKHVSLKENDISSNISTKLNVPDLVEKILEIVNANHCILDLWINEKIKWARAISTDGAMELYDEKLQDGDVLELCNELQEVPNQNWSLDLQHNDQISPIGYRYLADILSSTDTLIELCVADNNMNEEIRTTLLNGLCENRTLKKFDIHSNKLNSQDMESIGRFTEKNPMLKEIDLHNCEIDADGAINLAKFLPESSLEKLDLHQNSLGDRGCASLLSSIPPTLINLSLDENQITESSLETIVTFLTANRTLKALAIGSNPIFGESVWLRDQNPFWQQTLQAAKQMNICQLH